MGREISFIKTNGLKEEKIAISIWTIFEIKGSSVKSHGKPYSKWNEVTLTQRSQKEKGVPRYASRFLIKRTKKTGIGWCCKKGIIKIHGLFERIRFERIGSKNGQIVEISSKE